MDDHIVDLLGDYLADRLEAPERLAVEQHVDRCRECAADLAFARALREQGNAEWAGHLAPDRIVELASGDGVATTAEEAHLKICEECDRELAWVRATPPVPAAEIVPVPAGRNRRKTVSWVVGVTAMAAVAAAFLFMPRSPGRGDLMAMARLDPLPVQIVRGGEVADDREARRLRGLESYRDGDYEAAITALRPLAVDDLELRLYLGSALLLAGRPAEATAPLNAVIAASGSTRISELAMWQLANAHLASGNPQPARAVLERLRDLGGAHSADAARMLASFR